MIKGRTAGSLVGGGVRVETPRFVRMKKQTKVKGTVCDSGKDGGSAKIGDKKVTAVFVRKGAATLLKDTGGKRSKQSSLTSSSTADICTPQGGKRHLSATHDGEGEVSEGSQAKRMKVETEVLVRNSKKKKKRKRGQKVVATPAKKDHLEEALSYLKAWHNQKETWSFKKKMQLCLLEHMYDSSKVRKSSFAILLKYLEGLEGRSRGAEVQKAKQIVESYDSQHLDGAEGKESGETDDRHGTVYSRRQYKRAVEVLRVLA